MNFDDFKKLLPKIKKIPLPGLDAQLKMAPMLRQEELKRMEKKQKNARQSAVLALFYPNEAHETMLVLILRKTYKGVHSNQVGFPGGQVEKQDIDLRATALRETEEEVGVNRSEVEIIRQLTQTYIPPSNFNVQPFLAITEKTPNFFPEEAEVADILEIELRDFLDDSLIVEKELTTSYAENISVPAFFLAHKIVWGATAMMLSEVKDVIKSALSN